MVKILPKEDQLIYDISQLQRENKKLKVKLKVLESKRVDFCPDHRDKVPKYVCLLCEIEHLQNKIRRLEREMYNKEI